MKPNLEDRVRGPVANATVMQPSARVVVHLADDRPVDGHEAATRLEIARRLALVKGIGFDGASRPEQLRSPDAEDTATAKSATSPTEPAPDPAGQATAAPPRRYHVPSHTLHADEAHALGIRDEHDLFGGIVPHAFVATKAITHPLVDLQAQAPVGWSHAFADCVANVVLPGYTAFSVDDARRAGRRLLVHGPARVKEVCAMGGHGQTVVEDDAALDRVLARTDAADIARHGIVIEQNLADVTTWSVGQVRVDDLVVSYWGTQRLTTDNFGETVYGGSDLRLVRGPLEALLTLPMPDGARRAVEQARVYDAAADACFPGFLASRRNYDMVEGLDQQGQPRSGVLEQSWRMGGASGPEIAALQAFRADPSLDRLRARSVEVFGDSPPPPDGAVVYFWGTDPLAGPLTKYTIVDTDADG